MKKLKAISSSLALSLALGSAVSLGAATSVINVPTVHDAWTFIGVPGFQSYGASTTGGTAAWPGTASTTTPIIIDGSDTAYQVAGLEVPTWDGNFSGQASTTIGTTTSGVSDDGSTVRPAYSGAGVGSNIYGTVSVMAIGQDVADVQSTATDHDGATIAAISWTPMEKDYQSPIRTMYIQSPNAAFPDIKVQYQARYEGAQFNVQFETGTATTLTSTDNTTYLGTFDKDYTYDNAAVLGTDFLVNTGTSGTSTSGTDVSGILASFDMDFTDNNMSTSKNDIQPSTTTGSLRAVLDGNMTVLTWDSATQSWRQFRATGDGNSATATAANDFSSFEKGRGYWVKLDRDGGASINNPSGFVLGYDSAADINHSSYIADGWNMLSFGDEYLSYSVTGMIIDVTNAFELNITDTYGGVTLANITMTAAEANTSCISINQALDYNSSWGYSNFAMRCIPSTAASNDIVLLSTRRFTVQTVGAPMPLINAAGTLTAESNGSQANFYRSQYGIHTLVFEPNEYFQNVTGNDGNISVEFPADTVGAIYAAVDTVATTEGTLETAMDSASANLTSFANEATQLDMDYDGVTDAVLAASNYRFFMKDATLVRVFSYDATRADTTNDNAGGTNNYADDNNGTIRIIGAALTGAGTQGDVTYADDRLTRTAKYIDNVAGGAAGSRTEVNATRLGANADVNTTLMLYYTGKYATDSTRVGKIDLQEWADGWDVFTEIDASADSNATSEGAIAKVWHVSNLVNFVEDSNGTGYYDGIYDFTARAITTDMGYTATFAENFPVDGPLYDIVTGYGKKAEMIITGQTAASTAATLGTYISWKQIDVTKDPTEWYDNDDQFELFWTEKEKGYWVYLDGASTNDLSFTTPVLSGTPYAHFNNYFSGTASTATTRNQLNHTLTLTANNLTTVGTASSNTDAFEVYASIGGYLTSFQRVSATNGFSIPLDSHETNGITFDAGTVAITITAAEGSGKKVSTTYSLDYEKPVISSVSAVGTTATVAITNGTTAANTIHVYSGDINDSNYGTSSATNWAGSATVAGDTTDVNLGSMTGLSFPTAFEYNATAYLDGANWYNNLARQKREGIIKDVRFTAVDSNTLYADQYRLYYLPIYSGSGILSSSSNAATGWDANPVVYTNAGVKDADYTGAAGGLNDGVQLKSAVDGTTVSCAYAHEAVTLDESVANVKTLEMSDGTEVAIIAYMDEYIAQPFLCSVDGVLYVGGFVDADTYLSDIVLQPLSTSVSGSITK